MSDIKSNQLTTPTGSWGYTSNATTTMQIPGLKWDSQFAVQKDTGNECILVNTTTPADQVETVRFAINDVKNVYSGESDIDPTMYAPVKRGKSVVCSVKDTYRVTLDNGTVIDYPVSAHFVVKFPVSANISKDEIFTLVKRMAALGFKFTFSGSPETATAYPRFDELMRGALNPKA